MIRCDIGFQIEILEMSSTSVNEERSKKRIFPSNRGSELFLVEEDDLK